MKLLGLRLEGHDSNISYFDGQSIKYIKTERIFQEKHHTLGINNSWEYLINKLWGISPNDLDHIGIVSDSPLPSKTSLVKVDHHLAHALSCFPLTNQFENAIIIDGYGEYNISWTIYKNSKIIDQGYLDTNGSIGLEMAKLKPILNIKCFNNHDVAGKIMGLQSYGSIENDFYNTLSGYDIKNINQLFNPELWVNFKNDPLLAQHTLLDWVSTLHHKIGEILLSLFNNHFSSSDTIIYSGGVAQNVIWNTKLKQSFPNLVIPPHCADEGLSLGVLEFLRQQHNLPPFKTPYFPYLQSDESPELPSLETIEETAKLLSQGNVIGWYQGNGEIGPRALGNRSILFNPLIPNGKEIVNQIKKRENYRPFGASILEEKAKDYFNFDYLNPYMLCIGKVKDPRLKSITHIDGTCRFQTVNKTQNPIYYSLIENFETQTGVPILLNTSLNINGKPIAGYLDNAYELFFNSPIDYLVIGNKIISKNHKT